MKTIRFHVFVAAWAVTASLALIAQAQTPPPAPPPQQTASGTAGVTILGQTGDTMNGGYALGNGQATGNATDLKQAAANAAATAAGTSSQTIGTNSASSTANSVISTLANTSGATGTVTLGAEAGQGNWTTLTGDPANFSTAGNSTDGYFNGTETAAAPLQGTGAANATGESDVTLNGVGTNNASSTDKTTGTSQGMSGFTTTDPGATPVVSSGVSGTGLANAQSVAGNLNGPTYAGAYNTGTATYSGNNPTGAQETGNLLVNGKNNAVIGTPGNVSASSVVSSSATVKP